MSVEERLADWTPARFIEFVASVSEQMAWGAGVGGRETAGGIISYLALKPEHIEPFLNGGISELPDEWIKGGRLSWHAVSGKIMHPGDTGADNPQPSAQVRLDLVRDALRRATTNCGGWMREARRLQAQADSQAQALEEVRETLRNCSYEGEPARYRNARASLQLYALIEHIRGEHDTGILPSEVPY
ncbi:hypothetical protein ACLIMP_04380 [Novosphingobium aerophilum]|uniref:hypothetical protein n=1 Tax=Novosphingobium aerophilum TaxID=2839843 RepID=UPI00163D7FB5